MTACGHADVPDFFLPNLPVERHGVILKQKLTEQDKLKLRADFMLVREKGRKETDPFAILLYLPPLEDAEADVLKCGVICSRRFDRRAVKRNRARRLLWESFRLMKPRIVPCRMIFIPRREILNARMQEVAARMELMFARAGILKHSRK